VFGGFGFVGRSWTTEKQEICQESCAKKRSVVFEIIANTVIDEEIGAKSSFNTLSRRNQVMVL